MQPFTYEVFTSLSFIQTNTHLAFSIIAAVTSSALVILGGIGASIGGAVVSIFFPQSVFPFCFFVFSPSVSAYKCFLQELSLVFSKLPF